MTAEYFLNFLKGGRNLLLGVGCHEAEADEGILRSDSRRNNRVDEYAFLEEVACDCESLEVVADKKRDDGC